MTNPVSVRTWRAPTVLSFVLTMFFAAGIATAQQPPPPEGDVSLDLDVIAKQLDIARQQIEPRLGASVYDFGRQAIETQPQGDNQPLNRLLLQARGLLKTRSASCMSATSTATYNSV